MGADHSSLLDRTSENACSQNNGNACCDAGDEFIGHRDVADEWLGWYQRIVEAACQLQAHAMAARVKHAKT